MCYSSRQELSHRPNVICQSDESTPETYLMLPMALPICPDLPSHTQQHHILASHEHRDTVTFLL